MIESKDWSIVNADRVLHGDARLCFCGEPYAVITAIEEPSDILERARLFSKQLRTDNPDSILNKIWPKSRM